MRIDYKKELIDNKDWKQDNDLEENSREKIIQRKKIHNSKTLNFNTNKIIKRNKEILKIYIE